MFLFSPISLGGNWFRQMDLLTLFERPPTFLSHLQHIEFFRELIDVTETNQLAANQPPLVLTVLFADAVSRDVLMIPLMHLLAFRAGQHFRNLIDAKIKAAFFTQTINA